MGKNNIGQVHIIPFDLGITFYDEASLDNNKNIKLADEFTNKIMEYCNLKKYVGHKNYKVTKLGNNQESYDFFPFAYARHCIYYADLNEELSVYFVSSGIGIFVFYDLDGKYIEDKAIKMLAENKINQVVIARYQKDYMQKSILDVKSNKKLEAINEIMTELMAKCREIVSEITKDKKMKILRPYSACESYKHCGLSYVLTMYIVNKNEISEKEHNILLYSTMLKGSFNPENFVETSKKIGEYNVDNQAEYVSESKECCAYFSWSAISLYLGKTCSKEELTNMDIFKNILMAEIYVQSRWFLGDSILDNIKGKYYNLEEIEGIIGHLNLISSELNNETSANMNSFYKKAVNEIVKTSRIKPLFDSVSSQLLVQKNIRIAKYEKAKNKNRLILNIILSVFTAGTLSKAIIEFIDGEHSCRNWIIFGTAIILAISIIIINYMIDNNKK